MLFLQIAAYRKHRHKSFLLLALSTVMGFAALALTNAPHFVARLTPEFTSFFVGSAVCFAVGVVLGIWGVVSLFRSYRNLRNAT